MISEKTLIHGVTCECSDPACKGHKGMDSCKKKARCLLYRVDMQDETGTAMCDVCSDDAFSNGLFITHDEKFRGEL